MRIVNHHKRIVQTPNMERRPGRGGGTDICQVMMVLLEGVPLSTDARQFENPKPGIFRSTTKTKIYWTFGIIVSPETR